MPPNIVPSPLARPQLVVTGSSAGGIEALSRMLGTLPADFAAPIVVAQHLDPRIPSNLETILGNRTPLRVVSVRGRERLRAGTVYVVPANRHIEITRESVAISESGDPARPKPSIDLLFASAAAIYEERLIAVVLTGLGSDGATGAARVKALGGTVIIEDPSTATFPSMPASLAAGTVDIVASIDDIGAELVRLVSANVADNDDDGALFALMDRIRTANGIDFSHYKLPTIKRRLARQMATAQVANVADYLALLDRDPAEYARLTANFLIKVTEFFRDRETFELLARTIVPELSAQARARDGELRVWSAGCATGEEAYSLAILVAEAQRESTTRFAVRIFATDIDETAIAFARAGIYPAAALANVDADLVERYFTPVDGGYEVTKEIRGMTVFGQHDLGQRAPFPRIDLALCRNVLIYFTRELQLRTLQVFAFSLRSGGYLVLGKAETTNPLGEYFESIDPAVRIFRRIGERMMIPPAQAKKPLHVQREKRLPRRETGRFDAAGLPARSPSLNEKLGTFLSDSEIGVVLVDRHYDIASINNAARQMLGIHGISIGDDLIHLVPDGASSVLRTTIDGALRNEQPPSGGIEIDISDPADGDVRYLTVAAYPEIADGDEGVGDVVLLIVDVSEISAARRRTEQLYDQQSIDIERHRRGEASMRERLTSLLAANKQLAVANGDLRAQNDALVIGSEESEAAAEEIETLNEEMQATNEELETLNEEFQATIEELNTTNDELEVRSVELETLAERRRIERDAFERSANALAAFADVLPDAMAVVGDDGSILVANRLFTDVRAAAVALSVVVEDSSGATIPFGRVVERAAAGEVFDFSYRTIAADQAQVTYRGTARTAPAGSGARSILTLSRAGS